MFVLMLSNLKFIIILKYLDSLQVEVIAIVAVKIYGHSNPIGLRYNYLTNEILNSNVKRKTI